MRLLCVCGREETYVNNQHSLQELKYHIRRKTVNISRQDLHRVLEIHLFSAEARQTYKLEVGASGLSYETEQPKLQGRYGL